jgi:hypothetical protein
VQPQLETPANGDNEINRVRVTCAAHNPPGARSSVLVDGQRGAALDRVDRRWLSTALIENGPIRTGRAARLKVTVNLNRQADLGAGR